MRHARTTTQQTSHTFSLASRLLPRAVRGDVDRLYLIFRSLDDLIDTHDPVAADRIDALTEWINGGVPRSAETRALADIDQRTPLPRVALGDFAQGMRHDLAGHHINTHAELETYCYQVAGTVGVDMSALLGTHHDAQNAAIALGSAMQLTNILRDIDEDLAMGRRYLPVTTTDLAPGRRAQILRHYTQQADARFEEGLRGINELQRGRTAVHIAAAMYREILRQIERDNRHTIPGRSHVTLKRKLWIATRTLSHTTTHRPTGPRATSQGGGALRSGTSTTPPSPPRRRTATHTTPPCSRSSTSTACAPAETPSPHSATRPRAGDNVDRRWRISHRCS